MVGISIQSVIISALVESRFMLASHDWFVERPYEDRYMLKRTSWIWRLFEFETCCKDMRGPQVDLQKYDVMTNIDSHLHLSRQEIT